MIVLTLTLQHDAIQLLRAAMFVIITFFYLRLAIRYLKDQGLYITKNSKGPKIEPCGTP
jgi:hypothetical protein